MEGEWVWPEDNVMISPNSTSGYTHWDNGNVHLGKSATIRESNNGLGVCKEHYA